MPDDKKKSTTLRTVDKDTQKVPTKKETQAIVVKIQNEVTAQLASKEVMIALISTTFKDFSEIMVKQAITEGMIRGFSFQDFLNKNVYAIKYGNGYSLVASIDYSRKIGMKSGVVGKSAPIYTYTTDGNIETCTITIEKRFTDGYVGRFTETVYFVEYTTGKNQWVSKPRTMIAKVAEMHALRQACPEELAQSYVEEEVQKEVESPEILISEEEIILHTEKLESAKSIGELGTFWANLPPEAKKVLQVKKDELKTKLTPDENNKI